MIVSILNRTLIQFFLRKNLTGIEYKNLIFKTTTGKYTGGIIKYIEAEGTFTVYFKFGYIGNIYFNSFLNPQRICQH